MSASQRDSTGWLRDRTGWSGLTSFLAARSVPRRGAILSVGGVVLFLFLVQVASGILLLLYYRPDIATAHDSVERISGQVPYGDLIRNVHAWASDLFVAMLLAHFFVVLVRRTFKPPREIAWLSGLVTIVLGIGLAFTGSILPWSQHAYTQARVGTEIARHVPLLGGALFRFMRGGEEITSATLGHAFGFHVAVLPAALTLMLALHLFFLLRARPADVAAPSDDRIPVYPDYLVRQAATWTGVFVLLMTLAIFVDRPLGAAADPRLPSGDARAPWYFLPVHQLVRSAPAELLGMDGARFLVGVACGLGLVVVALPFIDRRGSKATAWGAWLALVVLLLLATSAIR